MAIQLGGNFTFIPPQRTMLPGRHLRRLIQKRRIGTGALVYIDNLLPDCAFSPPQSHRRSYLTTGASEQVTNVYLNSRLLGTAPAKTECYPFAESFVFKYPGGNQIFRNPTQRFRKNLKDAYTLLHTTQGKILRCLSCPLGRLFVIGADGKIVRLAEKGLVRSNVGVEKIPDHSWKPDSAVKNCAVVGDDIFTTDGTGAFWKNGLAFPKSCLKWGEEMMPWFVHPAPVGHPSIPPGEPSILALSKKSSLRDIFSGNELFEGNVGKMLSTTGTAVSRGYELIQAGRVCVIVDMNLHEFVIAGGSTSLGRHRFDQFITDWDGVILVLNNHYQLLVTQ